MTVEGRLCCTPPTGLFLSMLASLLGSVTPTVSVAQHDLCMSTQDCCVVDHVQVEQCTLSVSA